MEVDHNKPLLGEEDGPCADATAAVAEKVKFAHPYLLCDVEVYNREKILDIRDDAHRACKELWTEEAKGSADDTSPLPLPQPRHGGKKIPLGNIGRS